VRVLVQFNDGIFRLVTGAAAVDVGGVIIFIELDNLLVDMP
jgi:hypothetical protein